MNVTKSRSILKTISWRILASTDTFLLTWLVTGSYKAGLTVSGLEVITKMILYYFHERAWLRSNYGTNNN
jgi:uncharacterized membrane protein